MGPNDLAAEQIRAARAILRMEQTALATKAGVSVETIKRLEASNGKLSAQYDTLLNIMRALKFEGIEFIGVDDEPKNGGPGVRMALNRNAALIGVAVEEARTSLEAMLNLACRQDPKFFEQPVKDQVKIIKKLLDSLLQTVLSTALVKLDSKD
jgi:transcriptional regulator with XRE-family HTH domain